MTNIDDQHLAEFTASAIAQDIVALNFRSFDGEDENGLDEVFTLLIPNPKHNNNGTPSGTSQQQLAAILRSGGWIFEGYKGICVKPNSPRKDEEKDRYIKYESPRGTGNQQLFIPRISVRAGQTIINKAIEISKASPELEKDYRQRIELLEAEAEDTGFWNWFITTGIPLIVTEGIKKACSVVSAGYPAIGLNGVWGWGTNNKDMFGAVEKDDRGKSLKTIHLDLEPFLDGRELVLAFDRDINPETVCMVEAAKSAFVRAVEGEGIEITDLKWRTSKGIDDYIAAKGVKALARRYANRKEVKPPKLPKPDRVTAGDTLLKIGETPTYFHTADKVAYADIQIEGNRHTDAVRSKAFRLWLSGEFLHRESKGISSQILQDTLNTIEAIAIFKGETHQVHLRTAEHQGKIYLDLGTSDWKAVCVDAGGWRIVLEPPVRFWRPESLLPLPYPVEGGKLDELKEFINVDRSSWILLITFLLFCFCPNKTYPVLVISAHRGSGKTAAAEILKGLIDPGKAPLIKLMGDTLKLAVAAARRLLMVYDNVGHISADQSDDLCRMATNFGYSTRTLHTTDEETTFEFARPQIITAIDALVTRDDLADRVLMVQLGEITEDMRIPQSELNAKVEAARPQILGALLTALSQTLTELPNTNPDKLPRMADYAKFAIASEKALGLKRGEFMTTFDKSREQSRQVVIESSPVGEAIVRLVESVGVPKSGWKVTATESRAEVWKGTVSKLLNELEKHTDEATYRSRYFPKAANLLSRQLNRLAPDLKALGIEIKEGIRANGKEPRSIVLDKVIKASATSATSEDKDPEPSLGKGELVADTRYRYQPHPPLISHSSATDEVSATYQPLAEPLQGQTPNGVMGDVGDVGDVADKNKTFSVADKFTSNSNQEIINSCPVHPVDEKHVTQNAPENNYRFEVGDRVQNERLSKIGTIKDIRTKKTPKGTEFTQYFVDFGSDSGWFEDVVLTLMEVAQ